MQNMESYSTCDGTAAPPHCRTAVAWFGALLRRTACMVADDFEKYRLSEALMTLYKLYWDEFSGWYLEIVKPMHGQRMDAYTLTATKELFDAMLRLLHPFMPFITEELWQNLAPRRNGESIMYAPSPSTACMPADDAIIVDFEFAKQVVSGVRSARQSSGISTKETLTLYYKGTISEDAIAIAKRLANLEAVSTTTAPDGAFTFLVGTTEFYLLLGNLVDSVEERRKLELELDYYRKFLASVQAKLNNQKFVANAPEPVVALERRKQSDAESKIKGLEERLKK